MKGFQYGEFLKLAWEKMKKNYFMILGIFIMVVVVSLVFSHLVESMKETAPGIALLLWLVSVAVNAFLSLGFIRCLLRAADDEPIVFSEFFSGGDVFPVFLFGSIAYGLVVLGGIILLIVPGIIWSLKYSFVQYLIADQGMGVKEAFKKSGELTRGYKWNLFCLGALAALINVAGVLVFGVGLLLTLPLTVMLFPVVFRKLSGGEENTAQEAPEFGDIQNFGNWQ